jgi:hypothetical protein
MPLTFLSGPTTFKTLASITAYIRMAHTTDVLPLTTAHRLVLQLLGPAY